MKKIKFLISVVVVVCAIFSANSAKASSDFCYYEVCAVNENDSRSFKLYGDNTYGQLGISREIKSVSKENAININQLLGVSYIDEFITTKNNVFLKADGDVYGSGANNINQLGIKGRNGYYGFTKNSYLSKGGGDLELVTGANGTTNKIGRSDEVYQVYISNGKAEIKNYPYHSYWTKTPNYFYFQTIDIENNQALYKRTLKFYNSANYKKLNVNQLLDREEIINYNTSGKILKYSKKYTYIKYKGSIKNSSETRSTVLADSYTNKYNSQNQLIYKNRVTKNSKNKVTMKESYTFNGSIKKHLKYVYAYQKGGVKLKTQKRYLYNNANQLKSNNYGKAYRYTTIYSSKGKALKTYRQQYNSKGKLVKKQVKVKLIK